jgi:NAD(P)-dependent dehydrogenase (short-subunit alcohol dehydrogenase family)
MTVEVAGRVAVITGASRGLGVGLAEHFAAAGLRLGLCARHQPSPGVPGGSDLAVSSALDVTDHHALSRFSDHVVTRFGRIDLWVNNAGVVDPIGPLAEADPGALARNINVNVVGVMNGSSVFARHVRTRPGGGVLMNISSGAGTSPYSGWAAYCAAKAAVDHLTRVIALEEAPQELRAYAVAPGVIDTDMQAAIRQQDESTFPEVERFRQMATDGTFSSTAWVARHLLQIAFGPERPDQVTVRIPAEPVRGRAG